MTDECEGSELVVPTAQQKQLVIQLWDEGKTPTEIGNLSGLPRPLCYWILLQVRKVGFRSAPCWSDDSVPGRTFHGYL